MTAPIRAIPALLALAPVLHAGLDGQAPTSVRIQLPSGLTALLWEEHEAALIRVEGLFPIHPEEVPPHLPGLPALLLATLESSPKGNRTAAEFQALLDRSGIQMGLSLDPQGLKLSMACRSRDQELAFGLLGDLLGRSPLDPEALEPQRLKLFRRPLPDEATSHFLAQASGSILVAPPESTLSKAGLPELEALLSRIRRPGRLRLQIQGDLSPAQATQRLLLDLGAWNPGGIDAPLSPAPAAQDIKLPRLGPGDLLVAFPPQPADQATTALLEILLPVHLEGHGEVGDPWRVQVTGESPKAALEALQSRLSGLTFTEAELKTAKAFWKGRQALLPLDPAQALQARTRGLPNPTAVEALTRAELESALKALLAQGRRLWRGEEAWLKAVP